MSVSLKTRGFVITVNVYGWEVASGIKPGELGWCVGESFGKDAARRRQEEIETWGFAIPEAEVLPLKEGVEVALEATGDGRFFVAVYDHDGRKGVEIPDPRGKFVTGRIRPLWRVLFWGPSQRLALTEDLVDEGVISLDLLEVGFARACQVAARRQIVVELPPSEVKVEGGAPKATQVTK